MSKAGSSLPRTTGHRSAETARKQDPELAQIYLTQMTMTERGENHNGALCVVAAELTEQKRPTSCATSTASNAIRRGEGDRRRAAQHDRELRARHRSTRGALKTALEDRSHGPRGPAERTDLPRSSLHTSTRPSSSTPLDAGSSIRN